MSTDMLGPGAVVCSPHIAHCNMICSQALPNVAEAQPFLSSEEDVQGCGVPLGGLAPALAAQIVDKLEPYPVMVSPDALGHASESQFQWACEVRVHLPASSDSGRIRGAHGCP